MATLIGKLSVLFISNSNKLKMITRALKQLLVRHASVLGNPVLIASKRMVAAAAFSADVARCDAQRDGCFCYVILRYDVMTCRAM